MALFTPEDREFLKLSFWEALTAGALVALLWFTEKTVTYFCPLPLEEEREPARKNTTKSQRR